MNRVDLNDASNYSTKRNLISIKDIYNSDDEKFKNKENVNNQITPNFHPDILAEFKFKNCRKSIGTNPKDYSDFGLYRNYYDNPSNPDHVSNSYLPLEFKNDEKYKYKLFKYLRKPSISENKTICKNSLDSFANLNKIFKEDESIIKLDNTNCSEGAYLRKQKKIFAFTNKKLFKNVFVLINNEDGTKIDFNIFYDSQIGIVKKWQKQIQYTSMDDDVTTDSEQIELADRFCCKEMASAVKLYNKNKCFCRNYRKYHDKNN